MQLRPDLDERHSHFSKKILSKLKLDIYSLRWGSYIVKWMY